MLEGRIGQNTSYNNFGTDNRWVRLQCTEASWRLIYPGRYLHPLFSIPGKTHKRIAPDELHIIHLGISQYFLASVMWLIVFAMGGTEAGQLAAMWAIIQAYYSDYRVSVQLTNLSVRTFIKDPQNPRKHFPNLSNLPIWDNFPTWHCFLSWNSCSALEQAPELDSFPELE